MATSKLVVAVCQIIAARGEHSDTKPHEQCDTGLLRQQMASEAAGVFDDDRANAVAHDTIKQRLEPRPRVDRVRALHGRIVEPLRYRIACPPRKA